VGFGVLLWGRGGVVGEGAETLRGSSEKARAEAFAGDPVIAAQPARAAVSLFRRGGTEEGIEAVPLGSPARSLLPVVGSAWFLPGR
jgi:hypothetical protein